jgi:hypothetical protein
LGLCPTNLRQIESSVIISSLEENISAATTITTTTTTTTSTTYIYNCNGVNFLSL